MNFEVGDRVVLLAGSWIPAIRQVVEDTPGIIKRVDEFGSADITFDNGESWAVYSQDLALLEDLQPSLEERMMLLEESIENLQEAIRATQDIFVTTGTTVSELADIPSDGVDDIIEWLDAEGDPYKLRLSRNWKPEPDYGFERPDDAIYFEVEGQSETVWGTFPRHIARKLAVALDRWAARYE